MKEARLKTLNDCLSAIKNAHDTLEEVRDEEEKAYDNMSEGLQYSERGGMMKEALRRTPDDDDTMICEMGWMISSLD